MQRLYQVIVFHRAKTPNVLEGLSQSKASKRSGKQTDVSSICSSGANSSGQTRKKKKREREKATDELKNGIYEENMNDFT